MSSETRRYIVTQDSGCKNATTTKSRSFTEPDSSLAANDGAERYKFSEESRLPSASLDSSEGSDVTLIVGGEVDAQYVSRGETGVSYFQRDSKPVDILGGGKIQTSGSAGQSRYSYIKSGQSDYQMRATYNQFNKVTQGLERSLNFGVPDDIYCRPDLLALNNGNLLCAYLDNRAHPWCWNFPSGLIEPTFTVRVTSSTNLNLVQEGDAFSIAGTLPPGGTITGTVSGVDVAGLELELTLSYGTDTISFIQAGDTITIGAYTFTIGNVAGDPDLTTTPWKNSVSGAGRSNQTITLRLQTNEDRYWSVQSNVSSSPTYSISIPDIAFLDGLTSDSTPERYVGLTGISIVQYPDTDEVLVIYGGFKGRAAQTVGIGFNAGFLCVDSLDADFDTLEGFGGGSFSPSNRGNFIINQPDQSSLYSGTIFTDIIGLEDEQCRPLDLTAEVLPSGRLVVCVIFEDSAWSLVSDDRGVTFSATKIIDLTFGDDNYVLRLGTIDSTMTPDGRMAIIVCCVGLGDRGWGESKPSSGSQLPESVLSVFVSADGASWGREKKLGGGLYMPDFGDIDSAPGGSNWPHDHFDNTYFDQNLYCLSASITRTPEDTYLVTAVGYNQGNPGNGQSQQIYQRVLEVDELLAGQSGEDVAPTLPPQIYTQSEPFANEYQRLVVAKYQPSVKMDDPIGTGSFPDYTHPIVVAYLTNNMITLPADIDSGYLGQLYFARLPRSSASGFLTKGGGPFWSQGPIDVATCLWRDSVVTVSCGVAEFEPVDYPNSNPDMGLTGINTAQARRETYVEVLYSGGFQPALIKVPNWTRWWVRGFTAHGEKPIAKVPNVGATFPVNDLCYQLAGNGYQVAYNAPRNPFDQGWEVFTSGAPTETFANFTADNRAIFRGLYTNVVGNSGSSIYYGYAEELSAFWKDYVFPNSDGSTLKQSSDFGSTNHFLSGSTDPFSFVGRMVLSFPLAGGYDYATNSFPKSTIVGSKVELHRAAGAGSERISLDLRIGRDLGAGKVGIQLYDRVSGTTLCGLIFDNFQGLTSFNSNTAPKYEVVFGVSKTSSSLYYGRLMARRWDQYKDPDWLDDYSFSFNDSTAIGIGTVTTQTEHIRFGTFQSGTVAGDTSSVSWISYQLSRSFLDLDSAKIDKYDATSRALPRGMDQFITPGLNKLELPLDNLRNVNGGLFSSSSPSKTSIQTQMIDRGIELGFAGRSTAEDEFSYSAKSTMPTDAIFKLPASSGWRSISDTVAFETPAQNPTPGASPDVQVDVVPDYELMFDFGEEGVLPESLALFGINTDEVVVDFSDSSSVFMSLTAVSNGPSLSCWFSSPGGHATKIWNYLTSNPTLSTVEVTYKPNYLFYWENYSVIDGSAVTFSNGELEATLDADASPYVVRFKSAGWDSATSSIAENQGRYAPFIPSQFKSQPGENYYLIVYTREMYTDLNYAGGALVTDWSQGTDCRFRHVFKIKDNGSDHLILTSDIATNFTTVRGFVTAEKHKLPIGTMTIISDRAATNLPDFFPDVSKTSAGARGQDGLNRYRYMRLRLGGAQFHDPSENYLQIGMMIAGQRVSLGFRDIDWGWSYNLDFGNTLYTGITGQRRGRKNHKPRRDWTISYSPKPSQPIDVRTDAAGNNVNQYQNPMKGHGKIGNAIYPNNTEQMSNISKLSWMEAVQRVLSLEVNGDVVALAFDGDNMVNNHSLQTDFPQYGSIRPAASDPSSLVPARLIGYGGARNEAYQASHEIGNQPTGSTLVTQNTQCRARPIVTVSGLKFSEEL